jgi:hypothetical protein
MVTGRGFTRTIRLVLDADLRPRQSVIDSISFQEIRLRSPRAVWPVGPPQNT